MKKFLTYLAALAIAITPVLTVNAQGLFGATNEGFNTNEVGKQLGGAGFSTQVNIIGIIVNIIKFLLALMIFLAVLVFVIAGIMYITAGGSDRADTARQMITYAIIGLVVGLLGYAVVITVAEFMGAGGGE